MSRVLVITPTYDERENLPLLAERLLAEVPEADLLVIDDASPDGTGAVADELHTLHGDRVRVVHRDGKRGLGSAYVEGFRRAVREGYDVVVQMDAEQINIAQGSAGEADYLLLLARDLRYATEEQVAPLRGELDEIGAMLHALRRKVEQDGR